MRGSTHVTTDSHREAPSTWIAGSAARLVAIQSNLRTHAAELPSRIRSGGSRAVRRVAEDAWLLLQTTAAATLAWVIAKFVFDHPEPFFAPVAAVVALNTSLGEGGRVIGVIEPSHAGYRKLLQNLAWAAGCNTIAIPLAAGVLAPVGFVLPPASAPSS